MLIRRRLFSTLISEPFHNIPADSIRLWKFIEKPRKEQFYEKLISSKERLSDRISFSQAGIPNELLKSYSPWISKIASLDQATAAQVQNYNIQLAIQTFSREEGNIGCSEVQIAVRTVKILHLEEHLKTARKDFRALRLCEQYKFQRSTYLKYLKRVSLERYFDLIKWLKLTPKEISFTTFVGTKFNPSKQNVENKTEEVNKEVKSKK